MENTRRLIDKEKAVDIVNKIKYIINPKIDFILTKQLRDTKEYVIGITDNFDLEKRYVIRTQKKLKIINVNNHCFSLDNNLDECIEKYLLSNIAEGYHVSYVSLFMHIEVWEFIEVYLDDLEVLIKGVKKYLHYCERIGVTKELIDYYGESFHEELYAIFSNLYFEDYEILLSQVIGNNRLLLVYEIRFNQVVYSVIIFDEKEKNKSYRELYSKLDNAKTDFRRILYELSIIYYKEIEQSIDETTNYFINFIEGELQNDK